MPGPLQLAKAGKMILDVMTPGDVCGYIDSEKAIGPGHWEFYCVSALAQYPIAIAKFTALAVELLATSGHGFAAEAFKDILHRTAEHASALVGDPQMRRQMATMD